MTTRYVATTGSDAAAGTIGAPWLTISHGLATCATGDTLLIRGGTYAPSYVKGHDTLTVSNYAGEVVVVQRTSTGTVMGFENCRNITLLKNAGGGSFAVRSTVAGSGTSSGVLFYTTGGGTPGYLTSGITIDGLTVDDIAGWGIQVKNAATVIVQNCDVSHCGTGIRMYVVTGASYVQDCTVHNMDRMIVSDATANNDNGGTGVAADLAVGLVVRRNHIFDCHAVSVDYGVDGGAIEFYECSSTTAEYNIAHDNEGFIETGTGDASGYPMPNNTVRRNLVYGRASYRGAAPGSTAVMYIRAGSDYHIYNNTFDVDDGNAIFYIQGAFPSGYDAPITNLKIKNNLCVSRHASEPVLKIFNVGSTSGIEIDYNLFYNSTGSSAKIADDGSTLYAGTQLATWQAAKTYSDHDVWNSDPLWTNRSVRDYSLQTGSPAKNAGVVIAGTTDGYVGAAPDIGAFEYSVLPPPGGTPPAAPVITFPAADGPNYTGTVTISGACVAGASIELFDGATSKGIYPAPSTTWTFTLSGVSNAAHSYTAKATDSTSTVSAASNTRVITVDTTAPTVVSVSPVTHATGVSGTANVVVTFSKAIDPLTVTTDSFAVKEAGVLIPAAISFSGGNTVATYNPTPTLDALTLFSVELTAAIRDVAGNRLAG